MGQGREVLGGQAGVIPENSLSILNGSRHGRRSGTTHPRFRSTSVTGPSSGGADGLLSADFVAKVPNGPALIFLL
jgi:hypothetical protein